MRNFTRLARFAWPYRGRFLLSVLCAVMVAVLWFTNLGSVYFLLQILFHSQNCQKWVAEELVATEILVAGPAGAVRDVRAGEPARAAPAGYQGADRAA